MNELERPRAEIELFKSSGKYYTTEHWVIPTFEEAEARGGTKGDMYGPMCMIFSPDARLIGPTGYAVVITQEPWGYPWLITPYHMNTWRTFYPFHSTDNLVTLGE